MKSDPRLLALSVIMLAMSDRGEDIIRSYASGACSDIRKPVDLGQFHAVVKQFESYWAVISRIPLYHP